MPTYDVEVYVIDKVENLPGMVAATDKDARQQAVVLAKKKFGPQVKCVVASYAVGKQKSRRKVGDYTIIV